MPFHSDVLANGVLFLTTHHKCFHPSREKLDNYILRLIRLNGRKCTHRVAFHSISWCCTVTVATATSKLRISLVLGD